MIPFMLQGQSDNLLKYGTNLVGELPSANDIDVYRFEGLEGDRIWIRVADANSGIDASFRLRFGQEILFTVEGTGGDVELFDYTLADTGFYDIEVYDKNLNDPGAYGFSLHKLNNPTYASQIHCGDDIFDEIKTQVGVKAYQFSVESGNKAFAQMRASSSHLEATMYLFNENGDLLQKSVRKANPFAIIEEVEVTQDEKFSLFIFDANGNDVGTFGFTYQDLNDPTCGTIPLSCESHYENKIATLAETHAFEIQLHEGEGFVAKVLSLTPSMEASVSIFDPTGESIFQKTVSGKANDIVVPKVDHSGSYLMILNDDRANDTSSYFLTYKRLDISCAKDLALCGVVEDSLETKADIDLYYYFLPAQTTNLEFREIDPVIEPYASIIYDGTYQNLKDNVKLTLPMPHMDPGALVFLALSDNGGNDLGKYKVRPTIQNSFSSIPPVAVVKQDLVFTIPTSGALILTPEDLDQGSYDDCQIVDMLVSPNTFDCSSLGEHMVELTVIDNDGLINSTSTIITVISDLQLQMDACMKLSVEEYIHDECIEIEGAATGGSGNYEFSWSNGTTGITTSVCPDDVNDFEVKVTDSNGCEDSLNIWVPIGSNVICHTNGKKLTLCHYPPENPDNAQETCVNVSSLADHFGHGDLVGPCNGPCSGSEEIALKEQLINQDLVQLPGIIGHRGETLQMNIKDLQIEPGNVHLELVNSLGQILFRNEVRLTSEVLGVQLPDSDHVTGLYYLFIRKLQSKDIKQITLPILIQ